MNDLALEGDQCTDYHLCDQCKESTPDYILYTNGGLCTKCHEIRLAIKHKGKK